MCVFCEYRQSRRSFPLGFAWSNLISSADQWSVLKHSKIFVSDSWSEIAFKGPPTLQADPRVAGSS